MFHLIYVIDVSIPLTTFYHIVDLAKLVHVEQFRPPIALRTDLSHITTELLEIPVLWMAH